MKHFHHLQQSTERSNILSFHKCDHKHCSAEDIAIRDQLLIGLRNNIIRKEALKTSWDLKQLWHEGMKMERAARDSSEIAGDNNLYKVGK